jgi:Predicted membrane-associated Zn-dependent proteases 1
MSWLWVIVGFSLLIILHEGGHYVAAKATGMRVERFVLFLGPPVWSFKRGETEYGIAAIPLGGYVKITGMNPEEEMPPEVEHRAYYRQPVWKRIVVIAAGPAVNIALAFAIFTFAYLFFAQRTNQSVGAIRSGTPAAKSLQPDDQILAVDGERFSGLEQEARLTRFGNLVASHKCEGKQVDGCRSATPVTLEIRRGGAVHTLSVYPEYKKEYGKALIGFTYGSEAADIGLGGAVSRAGRSMWLITHQTASIFSHIFESEQRKQISGIVGVSDVAHETIEVGIFPSLLLLGLVSLSLGLINLLPILPLDGGHIFWSIVEKMRGEPTSLRVVERATVIGFALVAMLIVVGLTNDIGRITGEGFNVR